jgi:chemotaxis protein methyltransferase CheR
VTRPTGLPTADQLAHLRDLVAQHCGIRVDTTKLDGMSAELAATAQQAGMTFGDFCRQLAAERVFGRSKAWDALIPLVTNNESYFFRQLPQLRTFQEVLLPDLLARAGGRRIRVLSAPCATGEEAYTLAILAEEKLQMKAPGAMEIIGADLDASALEVATEARYGHSALRAIEPEALARYFGEESAGWRLRSRIRDRVTFRQVNLLAPHKTWPDFGGFDVILCRNLLIYCDPPMQAHIVSNLVSALNPGGLLLLGHSESVSERETRLLIHTTRDAVYYERVAP